jgi:hypothetical protein
MAAVIFTKGLIYMLSAEFSKQSIYITTQKIFDLLSFFSSQPSATSSHGAYNDVIRNFLIENHIRLKLSIAEEIIKERTDKCESKAVEITCASLHEAISKIYRELEKLQVLVIEHEKKFFYSFRTPNYEVILKKIASLMDDDFGVCFDYLERSISCSYVRSV